MNRRWPLKHFGPAVVALWVCGTGWSQSSAVATALRRAIQGGDMNQVRSLLRQGADPDAPDAAGNRPLLDAAAAGQPEAVRLLLAAGARVNATTPTGRTALIEAADRGQMETARVLIAAGADLNLSDRGLGSALEAAERAGHTELAAMLRTAGARTWGRSVGDKVCVRPWKGDGFCGVVEAIAQTQYRIHVTNLVGCRDGCSARADCSAGKPVGGPEGLQPGDSIAISSSCLTHTGVRP